MTDNKTYVLVLCIIVYVALTALFSVLITLITKQSLRLIRLGAEDEKIKTEYLKERSKKRSKLVGIIDLVIPIVCCVLTLVLFVSSFVISCTENNVVSDIPALKVVSSTSMAKKEEKNEYLTENALHDQLQMYDVIITYKLPDEFELKQYDIVVYEVDGVLLVHRIVNIEEPNEKHPNERWFQLQGDAVPNPDKFPVKYEQMKSIYRGDRIPFVGTFIFFLQSTAGMLCVLLMVFVAIITPLIEKKFKKEYALRLQFMGVLDENFNYVEPVTEMAITADVESENEEVENAESVEVTIQNFEVPEEKVNVFASFNKGESLTFRQKLQTLDGETINRYREVCYYALKYLNVDFRESKKYFTLTVKHLPLARFFIRGKKVAVCFPLNPNNFDKAVYGNTLSPSVKACENYPMQLKLTSNRKVKQAFTLLDSALSVYIKNGALKADKLRTEQVCDYDLCIKNYTLHEEEFIPEADILETRRKISFSERIRNLAPEIRLRYKRVILALMPTDKAKSRISTAKQTVKVGNTPIAKITVRGKTLCLYLNVNPSDYLHKKNLSTDVSIVKSHSDYPTLIRLTSERRLKNAIEIINEKYASLVNIGKLKEKDFSSVADFDFLQDLNVKLTFLEKIALASQEVKERYSEIINLLNETSGVKIRKSNNYVTAKIKSKKVAKIALRGKTLRVYLAISPEDYANTKYKFTNVSLIKAHSGYPMLIKITSNRKQKQVKELLTSILN